VDGEGITRWEPIVDWDEESQNIVTRLVRVHEYVLFSVGDQSLHKDGAPLTHDDIFSFLYEQKTAHPEAAFVGFFLGYDFSQWFKSVSYLAGWRLFHTKGIASRTPTNSEMRYPFPVIIGGKWQVDILAMKRLKLRPFIPRKDWPKCRVAHRTPDLIEECETGKHNKHPHPWMYICDSGSFFQSSLLVAINPRDWLKPIVTQEEWDILEEGKRSRSTAVFGPAMIKYNTLENDVLARLMRELNQGFLSDGIRLRVDQWFGPGQAAQAWLKLIGAPTGEEVRQAVPVWALEAARRSYYGGWFEVMIHGPIPGTTYGYDINSAYPHAIASLPCLLHGEWTSGEGRPGPLEPGHLRLVFADFRGHEGVSIGTMPHRDQEGGISRPLLTRGWHWQHELDAARRAGLIKSARVIEWVEYAPCDCPPPIAAIAELYAGRLAVGKRTPFGKAKKLVYNSTYGKMAQSVGHPKYSNALYASLITSHTRTMILDAIATHPDKSKAVVMVATDGVYFLSPHPTLPMSSDELGKWDFEPHENLSVLMPGLYWDDASRESIRRNESLQLRSRGVSGKYLAPFIDQFDAAWLRLRDRIPAPGDPRWTPDSFAYNDEAPAMEVRIEWSVTSPRLAAARGQWWECGVVSWDQPRMLSANPEAKRGGFYRCPDRPELLRSDPTYESLTEERESRYYAKLFGADMEEILLHFLEHELTPEGSVMDIIRALIPR
jgi:hypothetical protein